MNSFEEQPQQYNPYAAPQTIEANQLASGEIEVELASPWQRIGAVVINWLLQVVVFIIAFALMFAFGMSFKTWFNSSDPSAALAGIGLFLLVLFVAFIPFCIWQIVWMSKYGQSVGKRVMKIRVLTLDGDNPGFFGTVFMREIVYNIILSVINFMVTFIAGIMFASINEGTTQTILQLIINLISIAPSIICLVMLFLEKNNRRTLQDYLAKTIVVRV